MSGESPKQIDFIQPHAGEPVSLREEEIADASEIFRELVDNTQLAHAGYTIPKGFKGMPRYAQLKLEQPAEYGGWYNIIITTREAEVDSTAIVRTIDVVRLNLIGGFERRHQYTCMPGVNEVVRTDIYPANPEMWQLDHELSRQRSEQAPPLNMAELLLAGNALAQELARTEKFERLTNFNHLPVGEAEMSGLKELLQTAEPAEL